MTPHPDEGTLHAFIDGELSAAEAAALEAHFTECGLCGAALAEARGLVAGASRAISALDAAPSSGSRPALKRPGVTSTARPSTRPFVLRVPFARAAALLLLAGGSAVVINRSASDNGATSSAESLSADAALTEDGPSAEQPVQAAPRPISIAAPPLAAPMTGTGRSARRVDAGAGSMAQKQVVAPVAPAAQTPAAAPVANDGHAATDQAPRERAASAPPSAGAQSGRVAASGAAPTAPTAFGSVSRPPARMAASEAMSLSSSTPAVHVTRYRTKDGVMLILTEEPLRTSFAEESTVARRGIARPTAQASAPAMNTYRWSSAEQGKSFTLTGALSVAELEAASKRLSELERVP